mmetsp:Transcript_9612/g.15215  ORF Transcript_9612/g.15215 Transcript_9612/m.15215 type:complete len:95 (+) Transcript_9612:406-690(+)
MLYCKLTTRVQEGANKTSCALTHPQTCHLSRHLTSIHPITCQCSFTPPVSTRRYTNNTNKSQTRESTRKIFNKTCMCSNKHVHKKSGQKGVALG